MFQTVRNAFKVPELRNKIFFTLMMIFLVRFGSNLAVIPGVRENALEQIAKSYSGINLISDFSKLSIFTLGIMPYITASIVMMLLQIAVPRIEKMIKEDVGGRKKYTKIIRYLTIVLASIQAVGITFSTLRPAFIKNAPGTLDYLVVIAAMVAGTVILMWFGELITEKGLGNGISIIILINIIARVPGGVQILWQQAKLSGRWMEVIGLILVFVPIIGLVLLLQQGERRIAVQYAKVVSGRSVAGAHKTHIPFRVNLSGVMPIIFAMSLMQFPLILGQLMGADATQGWYKWVVMISGVVTSKPTLIGIVVYVFIIILFAYFFAQANTNVLEIADRMKKSAGFIPGVRPGAPTVEYLYKVLNSVVLLGALFLAGVALLPIALTAITGINVNFGGTSLLIAVGVSLEMVKQLEAQMITRHYKGFLR
ncbi:MAG: preprotein translocase subunit SecY [Clostridia bacterium]|jgi:preprotein translocase subunit SecY|nr:preprotein translocase subunit SecY [Clostridia bacterium]